MDRASGKPSAKSLDAGGAATKSGKSGPHVKGTCGSALLGNPFRRLEQLLDYRTQKSRPGMKPELHQDITSTEGLSANGDV